MTGEIVTKNSSQKERAQPVSKQDLERKLKLNQEALQTVARAVVMGVLRQAWKNAAQDPHSAGKQARLTAALRFTG